MVKQNLEKSVWLKIIALVTIQIFVFTGTGFTYSTLGTVSKVKKDLRVSSAQQSKTSEAVRMDLLVFNLLKANEVTKILGNNEDEIRDLVAKILAKGLINKENIKTLLEGEVETFGFNAAEIDKLANLLPSHLMGTIPIEMAEAQDKRTLAEITELESKIAELKGERSERQRVASAGYRMNSSRDNARRRIEEINAEIETLEEQKTAKLKIVRTVELSPLDREIQALTVKIAGKKAEANAYGKTAMAGYNSNTTREKAAEARDALRAEVKDLEQQRAELRSKADGFVEEKTAAILKETETVEILLTLSAEIERLNSEIAEAEKEAAMAKSYTDERKKTEAERKYPLQAILRRANLNGEAGYYLSMILAEIFPDDMDFELRAGQATNLKDEKNKRAFVINYRHLLEPGMAEVLKKIIDQLKDGGFKFVLDMDDIQDEAGLYRGIKKATYDRVDLQGAFDLVVSSKKDIKEAVQRIVQELDVQTIGFFGPQKWAINYRNAWGSVAETQECILLISEIGEGNKVTQPLGLGVALNAFLREEGILESDEIGALQKRWNKNTRSYDIPRKNVGEKHQKFTEYYRATAASE